MLYLQFERDIDICCNPEYKDLLNERGMLDGLLGLYKSMSLKISVLQSKMWSIKKLFRRKKKVDQYEIVESFQNTFESDNTIDFAVDTADLAFDTDEKIREENINSSFKV